MPPAAETVLSSLSDQPLRRVFSITGERHIHPVDKLLLPGVRVRRGIASCFPFTPL